MWSPSIAFTVSENPQDDFWGMLLVLMSIICYVIHTNRIGIGRPGIVSLKGQKSWDMLSERKLSVHVHKGLKRTYEIMPWDHSQFPKGRERKTGHTVKLQAGQSLFFESWDRRPWKLLLVLYMAWTLLGGSDMLLSVYLWCQCHFQ